MTPRQRVLIIAGIPVFAAALALAAFWESIAVRLSPPPPPEKLTIAISDTYIGSGLVFIAAAKGYFTEEGLAVTLKPHGSGLDALTAALKAEADIGTVGDTPIMFAAMKDEPVSVVATIFSAGRAHGIVARRDRDIAAPKDLKGRTIGITEGTDGHFILSVMLADQGLSLADVRITGLKPAELGQALLSGKVDAVSGWEPWLSGARQALGDNSIAFPSDSGFLFGFHLAGRKEWIAANPAMVQRMLKALVRAERLVAEKPAEAYAIIVAAAKVDPAMLQTAPNPAGPNYRFQLRLDQSLLIMLEDESQWALQNGLVPMRNFPNLLHSINMDAMLAVKPEAVSIVR